MRSALPILAAIFLSGCLGGPGVGPAGDGLDGASTPKGGPYAVVALIDTGINPYHVAFRDESDRAYAHPSTYLPGYPADAVAVNLTLGAATLEQAHKADEPVWKSLRPGTLYWFPGTKVVGAYSFQQENVAYSTGHGTMTASRAAANNYSLCPACLVVSVQGFTAEAVSWAADQPWIDAQSNSWSPAVVLQQADAAQSPGLADAFEAAAAVQAVFASAGNGIAGKLGGLGHPSFTRSTSGPTGVFSIGGHDNGDVVLWTGSVPHVVADACANWAAVGDTQDKYDAGEGGGTSSASPYAAGEAARLVLEARRLLNDSQAVGRKDGVFARGEPGRVAAGPLADGDFKLDELRAILLKTAVGRPVKTLDDGDSCGLTGAPYATFPVS